MSWQSFTVSISTDRSKLSYSPHHARLSLVILGNEKNIQTGKLQKKQFSPPPNTRHILPPRNKRPTCSLLKNLWWSYFSFWNFPFWSKNLYWKRKKKRKGKLLSALYFLVIVRALNMTALDLNSCLDRCFLCDLVWTVLIPTSSLAPKHFLDHGRRPWG